MPSICCICRFTIRKGKNIFEECIGKPPILIKKLILECTGVNRKLSIDSGLCPKCLEKLERFYRATQIAKRIKLELKQLLLSSYVNRNNKTLDTNESAGQDYFGILQEDLPTTHNVMLKEESIKDEGKYASKDILDFDFYSADAPKIDNIYTEVSVEDGPTLSETKLWNSTTNTSDEEFEPPIIELVSDDEDYVEQKHIKKTERVELKCSECDQSFTNQRKYQSHIQKEHSAGFICDQCGKKLISHSGFIAHCLRHNPVKEFECPECGERYHLKSKLKHHMAWHTGEKPFQCDICEKRFVHRVGLYTHKQIHDNETRRIECKECGFKFRTNSHLRRHMMTHTGAKPFSCPICGKCFAQLYNMKAHVQEHENPGSNRRRRLKCKKCSRTFTNNKNYEEHCQSFECKAGE